MVGGHRRSCDCHGPVLLQTARSSTAVVDRLRGVADDFEDESCFDVLDFGACGQIVEHELAEVLGVLNGDVEKVVVGAADVIDGE